MQYVFLSDGTHHFQVSAFAAELTICLGDSEGGLVFEPTKVTAAVDDLIAFIFITGNHSVVQSTFVDPCIPLATGAYSGYIDNPGARWSVVVVDISAPMWFYCQQTIPVNHCQAGMVFAVNPTSDQTFVAFQQAAMASDFSSSATDSSGSSSTTTGSTLISISNSVTATPESTGADNSSAIKKHKHLVIGIAAGGTCCFLIICLGVFFVIRWKSKFKVGYEAYRRKPAPFTGLPGPQQDYIDNDVVHNPLLALPRRNSAIREKVSNLDIVESGVEEGNVILNDASSAPADTREILQELNTLRRELAEVRDAMAGDGPLVADRANPALVDNRELLQELNRLRRELASVREAVAVDTTPPPTYYRGNHNGD
ncbi:hypothetical protein BDQ17DRAFT_1414606 [Cyathus striatus]|nr:hypothetical protein BDQ17DRAFT_1414606 [Cyathus striatus]